MLDHSTSSLVNFLNDFRGVFPILFATGQFLVVASLAKVIDWSQVVSVEVVKDELQDVQVLWSSLLVKIVQQVFLTDETCLMKHVLEIVIFVGQQVGLSLDKEQGLPLQVGSGITPLVDSVGVLALMATHDSVMHQLWQINLLLIILALSFILCLLS